MISLRLLWLLPLCLLQLSCATREPTRPIVLCHYMSWFQWRVVDGVQAQSHWAWQGDHTSHDPSHISQTGRRDIASVYYPRIGVYDSADPAVIDYHIRSAQAAGIEGFVVDWYRPRDPVDQAMNLLFDRAEALDFKIAVCLEEKMCFPDWYAAADREAALARGRELVGYLLDTYADRPAYWRINDRPAIFVFNGWGDWGEHGEKTFTGEEWGRLAAELGRQDWYVIPQHFNLEGDFVRAAFGWIGEAGTREWFHEQGQKQLADGAFDFYVGPANPGFDDRGVWGWGNGPRYQPHLGTATYETYWRLNDRYRPAAIQIATWNDFGEGTVIEPTAENGTLYLDVTERWVGRLTGRPIDLSDNEQPYLEYLASRLGKTLDDNTVPPPFIRADQEPPPLTIETPEWSERQAIMGVAASPANLAREATATASSLEGDTRPAMHAIDADLQTRWASAHKDDQWLQLSWPEPLSASELALIWESAYGKRYDVQLSDDGNAWTTVATVQDGKGGCQRIQLPQTPFRHLRLLLHERGTAWGFSLHELTLVK